MYYVLRHTKYVVHSTYQGSTVQTLNPTNIQVKDSIADHSQALKPGTVTTCNDILKAQQANNTPSFQPQPHRKSHTTLMKSFLVTWEIDIDANNAADAALEAKRICNNMDFSSDSANTFSVTDKDSTETTTVDLGETTIMDTDITFADMRTIAARLVGSDVFHEATIRDLEECNAPNVDPLTDFFYALDLSNPQLAELFAAYNTRLEAIDNGEGHDFATHADFVEFVIGRDFETDIPGIVVLVVDALAASGYPTVSDFCDEHGVIFAGIKVA